MAKTKKESVKDVTLKMARYIKSAITGGNLPIIEYVEIDANQTIKQGDLIQIDATSRKGVVAVAASTSLVGIAGDDITTGASVTSKDRIPVTLIRGSVMRIDYTGTTKTTLADGDKYLTSFDLSDKKTLNLDDTTGGMLKVIAFDNTKKTADVIALEANLAF
jgi:hypothetical protein